MATYAVVKNNSVIQIAVAARPLKEGPSWDAWVDLTNVSPIPMVGDTYNGGTSFTSAPNNHPVDKILTSALSKILALGLTRRECEVLFKL